jgi:hypothetical protein
LITLFAQFILHSYTNVGLQLLRCLFFFKMEDSACKLLVLLKYFANNRYRLLALLET